MGDSARKNEQADASSGLKLAGPRIVQFPQSAPRVSPPVPPAAESAPAKNEKGDPFVTSNAGRIGLIIGIALSIGLFVWASGYVIQWAHSEIGSPEPAIATSVQPPGGTPALLVTADMLHVSSIALGKVRLAVVNGEELIEGDSLKVKTPAGDAMVCATRIKDGIVRFVYRGRTIDAHMSTSLVQKPATH
jgi:hypothetical protein